MSKFQFSAISGKNRFSQGKIPGDPAFFTLQLWHKSCKVNKVSLFNNRATGVFDGQDRRRRDEDGERKRSQVC